MSLRQTSVLIIVDDRGAVYLGQERYLAGEADGDVVRSYVPGYPLSCGDMGELVERWGVFRAVSPSYDVVVHSERSGKENERRRRKELCPW